MELKLQKFRLSLVLNSVFFPLTSPDVFDALKAREFEVGRVPVPFPSGVRVYFSGAIARKRDVWIDIDSNRNIVGTEGVSVEDTIQTFSEVIDMLREDFFVDLNKELSYVELIAHLIVFSAKNPLQTLQSYAESKKQKEFDKIFGDLTSDYRVSIVPRAVLPSSRKWFEINVSPRLTMPTKAYWLEVVYRDETDDSVVSFARNLNPTIVNLITVIERR